MRHLRGHDPLAEPEVLIRRVYSYVAYRLGDGHDAEDVTSDVFERALRYRKSYNRSKGEPVAWLLGIAKRCTNESLAARREHAHELEEHADAGNLEEDSLRRLDLESVLSRLSSRDQELIALRFGADLTAAQIADVMDSQTNAIEVALHRALDRLRKVLQSEEEATDGLPRTSDVRGL
jgi:RNA polymerase sigma factor (sigma-70 family)